MSIPDQTQTRLRTLTDRYSAAGLPLTTQRRTLIEVLAGCNNHPTVDQIYSAVSERLPEVSRATVYRSLEVLSDLDLIRRVEHPASSVRFDPNMEPHHHFLCTHCEGLTDLAFDSVAGFESLSFVGDAPSATRLHKSAIDIRIYPRTGTIVALEKHLNFLCASSVF